MTTLHNSIHIAAAQGAVWKALTDLDQLAAYDPGVRASHIVGEVTHGPGAQRRCELRPAGWFVERVVTWEPEARLGIQLFECSLPVLTLRHDYTLEHDSEGTIVTQVMTYELKYGAVGRLLDAVAMRRNWDAGIKAFLAGLKDHVEATADSQA